MPTDRISQHLTLSAVAILAGVQRSVVAKWRKRAHPVAGPFPSPVAVVDGVEHFDCDAVVTWLERSGRGKNPEARLDAVLNSCPPIPTPAGLALAQACLAVAATSEVSLPPDVEDLRDLAEEVDPDDQFAMSECLDAQDADLLASADYARLLVNAARGPAEALLRLNRDSSRFNLPPDRTAVAPDVLALAATLVVELGQQRQETLCVADATGCSADLMLATLNAAASMDVRAFGRPCVSSDPPAMRAAQRAAYRTLIANGFALDTLATDDEGAIDTTGVGVVFGAYPHAGCPGASPSEILNAVDNILVQLPRDQFAVIFGPSSTMADALGQDDANLRRAIMDTGRVRAVVRFGFGSTFHAPQQRMVMWVVGPIPSGNFRDVGRTAVADLSATPVGEVADDLVADILAAIQDRPIPGQPLDKAEGRVHTARVARFVPTSRLFARQELISAGVRIAPTTREFAFGEAMAVSARVARSVPGINLHLTAADSPMGSRQTLEELVTAKRLKEVQGCRLSPDEWDEVFLDGPTPPTAVPVIGPAELTGEKRVGGRVINHLAFAQNHPRNERTEAGDVVFCVTPRPAAWVDQRGGSVVEFPARALRIRESERADHLIPRVLAADITAGRGRQWRTFYARLFPSAVVTPTTTVLNAVADAKAEAEHRVAELTLMTELLADGIHAGQITAMMELTHQEGH